MLEILTRDVIESELSGNEKLLWSGKPRQGIVFRSFDIFMVPFSLIWAGFAVFWEIMVLIQIPGEAGTIGIFFAFWGVPFVLAGLYILFGRFIIDSKRRKHTFYGVSDERIITVSGIFSRKVESVNLKTLSNLSLKEKTDKSGTISFGQGNPYPWWFNGYALPGMYKTGQEFEMIEDARKVYEIIRKAQTSKYTADLTD